jgi:hypothetical protein
MSWQLFYYCALAVLTLGLFDQLVMAMRQGKRWKAAALVWCASPIMLGVIGVVVEQRSLDSFSLSILPWSLLFGDGIFVTLAAWTAADAQLKDRLQPKVTPRWDGWTVVCLAAGLAGGVLFHQWDVSNYTFANAHAYELSPLKVAHDFGTFTILLGAMLRACVPLLLRASWRRLHNWVLMGCLACWGVLVVLDGRRGLSGEQIHIPWYGDASWLELFHTWGM